MTLEVRQQPQQALITSEHKEKSTRAMRHVTSERLVANSRAARKAIDPPPIVQIKVDEKRSHDQGYDRTCSARLVR